MVDRPYTLLSCAVSLDGYLDSPTIDRVPLSCPADFERVDAVRAGCDAILVGAATVRNDNPRLIIRSPQLQQERIARGQPPSPAKISLTTSGRLDLDGRFFTAGTAEKIIYTAADLADGLRVRLAGRATVVGLPGPPRVADLGTDLAARGIGRLMVEGGGTIHTQFLTAGLADELQLVVAPVFIGDSRAHRFALDGRFPWNPDRRAELAEVRRIGDVVLLRYALSARYDHERIDP